MTPTTEELQAMLAIAEKATPGPYTAGDSGYLYDKNGHPIADYGIAHNADDNLSFAEAMDQSAAKALLTELLSAREALKVAEEAMEPFAGVATHGTFGGPLVALAPIYEDGSEKKYKPSPLISHEDVARVAAALTTIRSART